MQKKQKQKKDKNEQEKKMKKKKNENLCQGKKNAQIILFPSLNYHIKTK